MNRRTHLVCAWAGPLYVLLFLVGLLVAGYVPPPSPDDSAEEVAAMFADDTNRIRIGLLIVMGCQGLFAAFVSEVTVQLRRVEGRHSPLAYMQLGLGMLAILLVILPMCLQEVAAFRPDDRSPETLQLLADASFIPFIGAWFTVVFQWIATGVVILQDQRAEPLFPRWAGYANLWVATMSIPSTGLYFMKTGPFAWDGLLSFWFAAAAFFAWALFMALLLVKAIDRQYAETEPDPEVSELAREVAVLLRKEPAAPQT